MDIEMLTAHDAEALVQLRIDALTRKSYAFSRSPKAPPALAAGASAVAVARGTRWSGITDLHLITWPSSDETGDESRFGRVNTIGNACSPGYI